MKIHRTVILFCIVFVLLGATAFAQARKFRWSTELCEFEGTYDAKNYTEAQLRDTQKLLASIGYIPLFTDSTAANYADIKKLSVEELDKEYRQKSAELKKLDIVKSAYWETLRQNKLKEMEQSYKLKRITIQGYANPAVLKEYAPAAACIEKYANPLIAGGDSLLDVWLKVNEDSRKKNASPERLKKIFEEQSASPDKFKYAVVEVMSFGWWNCANETIEYVEHNEKLQENFRKLFKSVKTVYCDEP